MNKYYIYIMANTKLTSLYPGYCRDILKTIAWCQKMPPSLIVGNELNRLIWIGIAITLEECEREFVKINGLTFEDKIKLINDQNENFVELIPGQNIDIT